MDCCWSHASRHELPCTDQTTPIYHSGSFHMQILNRWTSALPALSVAVCLSWIPDTDSLFLCEICHLLHHIAKVKGHQMGDEYSSPWDHVS